MDNLIQNNSFLYLAELHLELCVHLIESSRRGSGMSGDIVEEIQSHV